MRATIELTLRAVASAVVLASALTPLVIGQQGMQNNNGRPVPDARDPRERDLRARQFDLRRLEEEAHRPAKRRQEPQLALAQIKEDYLRIQLVNNDLVQAVSSRVELDLKFVAKSASEIKKRAGRLKDNLVLPKPEEDSKRPQVEAVKLESALLALDELINGFVRNPIFNNALVVDASMAAKARRDLEEIINLSDEIKKSSEKLSKDAQKSQ
ncbi:MAG TPA: hypothetical protein VD966_01970 [Pyrinomonadaceae bacterium]|nr:hypothetical protein [Pyrinomonadaceae bacterium]